MDFPVTAAFLVKETGMPLRTAQGLVESVSCGKIGRTHFAEKDDVLKALRARLKGDEGESEVQTGPQTVDDPGDYRREAEEHLRALRRGSTGKGTAKPKGRRNQKPKLTVLDGNADPRGVRNA